MLDNSPYSRLSHVLVTHLVDAWERLAGLESPKEVNVSDKTRISDLQAEVRCKDGELAKAFERARKYATEIGQYREEIEGLRTQLVTNENDSKIVGPRGEPLQEARVKESETTTPKETRTMTESMTLGAAFSQLTNEHGKTGMKIGGSAFVAKKIVGVAQNLLKKTMGKKKAAKYIMLMDTKLGRKITATVVPGAIYLAAKVYPKRIPKATLVANIAGYAVTGSIASLTELALSKSAPIFKAVAALAEDLPDEIMEEVKSKEWGNETKEANA